MKKTLLYSALCIIMPLLLSGCATHYGYFSGSVALSSRNFKFVKFAKGEATTTKIFLIGGLGKEALAAEAKSDLLQNNPLQEGQALANVTLDYKTSIIFFYMQTKATITADIVEFK